jgi:hypothetical protein
VVAGVGALEAGQVRMTGTVRDPLLISDKPDAMI